MRIAPTYVFAAIVPGFDNRVLRPDDSAGLLIERQYMTDGAAFTVGDR